MNNNAFAQARCSFFSLSAQQKHADAICIGVTGNKREGDRRKPRERCRNPRSRRVGGAENPQSSTRIRSGGGRRWSTCIKRWNVATLSPRRRGDTARPIQGDRRKPRERRRSPKSRRVAGTGKSSVLHPDPQRRRQTVEHMHQAVERRHTLPQAEGRHRAAHPRRPEEAP